MTKKLSFPLRIGTRGSALALIQAGLFAEKIRAFFPEYAGEDAIEIVKIRASGDYDPASGKNDHLRDSGGKGLFTKELEEALIGGRIDMAIHSMKDVPTWMPPALTVACVLERGEVRDAFISPLAKTLLDLPQGARLGTSSLRRQAQILARRPDIAIVPFRGNVDTRLKKLETDGVQAIVLAACGLQRLGLESRITSFMDVDELLPSVAQGVVGAQILAKNEELADMMQRFSCPTTMALLQAERAMLEVLDGSCATPIAGLATIHMGRLRLAGLVAHPEGKGVWRAENDASPADAVRLGQEIGRMLRHKVPPGILPEA